MNRLARTLLLLLSLSLAAAAQPKTWGGTWVATVGSGGRAFRGTWDATPGRDPDTVLGNWTVMDQAGATVADGTWSARKAEKIWKGSWQARGRSGQQYAGTWRAQSQLPPSTQFAELFEFALTKIAGGTWQMSTAYSGTWSNPGLPAPMMVLLGKLLRDHICDPQIEKPDRIPKCEAHALSVLINSIWRVLTWIR